ncbi:MAG: hypothetical protein K9M17_06455 [Mariprofundaceae bacterium]|nr:hypothetical protein [Mariprofundaceae bacterium]
MKILFVIMAVFFLPVQAHAVTPAEDIASTIMLRGHPCGGPAVTQIQEQSDGKGNRTIRATCPNGYRYQVDVSSEGRVSVKRLN